MPPPPAPPPPLLLVLLVPDEQPARPIIATTVTAPAASARPALHLRNMLDLRYLRASVECLPNRHRLHREVRPCGPGHGIIREVPLHGTVLERVVQRCHDHRLIEHQGGGGDGARG